jgi:hypothetical protein
VGGLGAGVVVVAGCGSGAHLSATARMGSFTRNEIDDSGLPGGTFIVNDSFARPSTVTVITQACA